MGGIMSCVGGDRETRGQGAFYKTYKINDALGQKLISVGIGKKQLFELHQIFNIMDKDNSGEINVIEFFDYVDLKRTRFSEKAFSVMDRDGSGEVDFIEFVLAVWNYCSFSHASLVRYAFDLYDSDGSGEIELAEASLCVREVWGSDWERNANAQKVLTKLESIMRSTPSGRLTVKMFEDFSQTHPMLLFPAFQLQTEIQQRVLGERFWHRAAKRRSLIDPKELNMKNIEKLMDLSRQTSQKFLQTVDDALHDNIFEAVDAAPRPRKRSSIENLYLKARSRTTKVFLEAKAPSAEQAHGSMESSTTRTTTVTPFESGTSSSPNAKKQRASMTTPTRPPPVETATLPLANRSQSSFGSTKPVSSSSGTSPTNHEHSPTKKKKKKAKTPTAPAKADLVVEDVAEPGS